MDAAYRAKEDAGELAPVKYEKFELKHGAAEHSH
jgi:hypothetical protein